MLLNRSVRPQYSGATPHLPSPVDKRRYRVRAKEELALI
jgi:hypothetical protein